MITLHDSVTTKLNNTAGTAGLVWANELNMMLQLVSAPLTLTQVPLTTQESLSRAIRLLMQNTYTANAVGNDITVLRYPTTATNEVDHNLVFWSPTTNTGNVTIDAGYGAKPLRYPNGTELAPQDIVKYEYVLAQYNAGTSSYVTYPKFINVAPSVYYFGTYFTNPKVVDNPTINRLYAHTPLANDINSTPILKIDLSNVITATPIHLEVVWVNTSNIINAHITLSNTFFDIVFESNQTNMSIYRDNNIIYINNITATTNNVAYIVNAYSTDLTTLNNLKDLVTGSFVNAVTGTLQTNTFNVVNTTSDPLVNTLTFTGSLVPSAVVNDPNGKLPIMRYVDTNTVSWTVFNYVIDSVHHQMHIQTHNPVIQSHRSYNGSNWSSFTTNSLDTSNSIIALIRGTGGTLNTFEAMYNRLQSDLTIISSYSAGVMLLNGDINTTVKAPTPTAPTDAVPKLYMDTNYSKTGIETPTVDLLHNIPVIDWLPNRTTYNETPDTLNTLYTTYTSTGAVGDLPAGTYGVFTIRDATLANQVAYNLSVPLVYTRVINSPDTTRTLNPWIDTLNRFTVDPTAKGNLVLGSDGNYYTERTTNTGILLVNESSHHPRHDMSYKSVAEGTHGYMTVNGVPVINTSVLGTSRSSNSGLEPVGSMGYDMPTDNIQMFYRGYYGYVYINADDNTLRATGDSTNKKYNSVDGVVYNQDLNFPVLELYDIVSVMVTQDIILVQTINDLYGRGKITDLMGTGTPTTTWTKFDGGSGMGNGLTTKFIKLLEDCLIIDDHTAIRCWATVNTNANMVITDASNIMLFDPAYPVDYILDAWNRNGLLYIKAHNRVLMQGGTPIDPLTKMAGGLASITSLYLKVSEVPLNNQREALDYRITDGGYYAKSTIGKWDYHGYTKLATEGVNGGTLVDTYNISRLADDRITDIIVHDHGTTYLCARNDRLTGSTTYLETTGTRVTGINNTGFTSTLSTFVSSGTQDSRSTLKQPLTYKPPHYL